MKKYCCVENNEIKTGPCELPVNTESISNLNLLDDDTLKQLGWIPCRTISDNKPVVVESQLSVTENEVIETLITRDFTEEEAIANQQAADIEKWQEIRSKRDRLLTESDKKVVSDKWESMSSEDKAKWTYYRQCLRNIPQTFLSPNDIIWPTIS